MGNVYRAVLASALLSAGCGSLRQAPPPPSRPYVVLVSFDAMRYDYLDRFKPPTMLGLASRGVRAEGLIPSFPSKTFPNHFTLVTGLYPGDHGIVGNAFFDPGWKAVYRSGDTVAVREARWYRGEPIWVTAEKQGVRTAVYFWPGSEAPIGGVRPTYVANYDAKAPNTKRVDEAMAWMRKPGAARPHLLLMYFSDVDDSTHLHGPDSPQASNAVAAVDRTLRRLTDSLSALPFADSINVVLVSDHGMANVTPEKRISVGAMLVAGGVDTTGVLMSDNGPTISLWFGGDSARIHAAHVVLDEWMAHAHAYLRSETPERWHVRTNPRAGDLLLVAEEGYVLERRSTEKPPNPGAHGYDPAVKHMRGIFIASGPNVRPLGTIPAFENVNVYPFLAALLHLERVPATDGSVSVLGFTLR
jgi:predicted AlkP superfamily pyrophosphatase or phosphodiesterase